MSYHDTFTGSASSSLLAHTSDSGHSYSAVTGDFTLDGANEVYAPGEAAALYTSWDSGGGGIDLTGIYHYLTAAGFGAYGVYNPSTGVAYWVGLRGATGDFQVFKETNGSGTTGVGSNFSTGQTTGSHVTLEIQYSTPAGVPTIVAKIGGSTVATITDPGGDVGCTRVYLRNFDVSSSVSTDIHLGAVTATTLGPTASIALTHDSAFAGIQPGHSGANTVLVTGTATSFSGSPFTLSGGTSAAIVEQDVIDGTHAVLTLDYGTAAGTLTITDTGSSATATDTVSANAAVNQLVFLGDSFDALLGLTPEADGPLIEALKILGPTWTAQRIGTSGATITDQTPGHTQINWAGLPSKLSGKNVVAVTSGLNDFAIGVTAAQVYAYLKSVKLPSLKSGGSPWYLLVYTLPPDGAGLISSVTAWNALVRASAAADFAGLIEWGGASPFGDSNVANNLRYFQSDHRHPQPESNHIRGRLAAGTALEAQYVTVAGAVFSPLGGGFIRGV